MPVRAETYAFARPVPYLLQRGTEQTIEAPIRHGATGSLVEPTASGSTVTITRPDGTELVSGASVTVSSSTAQYDVTPSASETLGPSWTVEWSLVIDSVTHRFRQSAFMCQYVPTNVISAIDLYEALPDLKAAVPQEQGERGSNVGWQPQIDSAFYAMVRKLIDDGRQVWKIREVTGAYDWLNAKARMLCIGAIRYGSDSTWAEKMKDAAMDLRRAEASWRIQYDDESATIRRGQAAKYTLAGLRSL